MSRVGSTTAGWVLLAFALTTAACAGKSSRKPDGSALDAGLAVEDDAGPTSPDTGHPTSIDAGSPEPDAGSPAEDAGTPDEDAGSPDEDAGVEPVDAGLDAGDGYLPLGPRCFGPIYHPGARGPNYDQFEPVVGSHCQGTNYQQIEGVQRVVFVGDSITVGSPGETLASQFYRVRLAQMLATKFNLSTGDPISWNLWQNPDSVQGRTLIRESGDFASCAKWGARVDDLIQDNHQIEDCIPPEQRNKRTLVIMTIGGNDIDALAKDGLSQSLEASTQEVQRFVQLMRDAIHWFKDDPTKFPNGVFVVFGNMYEFTDGTGDTASCPAAGVAGIQPWPNPDDLANLVIYANEQFLDIAVETHTDMIFMLEQFCGHGYHNMDPASPCYRPNDNARYFDLTCIHPNPAGHEHLANMFMSVVNE